jgi:ribose 1,5-bisphosphokinase
MSTGTLVYIVGASGAGKDSLLSFARPRLSDRRIVFAHRYITRPCSGPTEIHVPLTPAEFSLRLRHGLFALYWDSHGVRYGIGREIDGWLSAGLTVVVNGSRAAVPHLLDRYPAPLVVMITASVDTLRRRLIARGRETACDIEERLAGAGRVPEGLAGWHVVANDGPLDQGGAQLVALLRETAPPLPDPMP